jgi:hypothetical protein
MVSVTELLAAEGFIDSRWFEEYYAIRGTYVHRACELLDKDELEEAELDPALVPYVAAWQKFMNESGFKITEMETRLVSETYKFTGKPDRVGALNGYPAIIDLKSGVLQSWTALQLAGYEILKGSPHKRFGVQLTDEGTYKLKEYKDRQDRNIFLAALACYNWKQNNLKKG